MIFVAALPSRAAAPYGSGMEHAVRRPPARSTADPGVAVERFCVALCHDLRGPVATAGAALHRLAHAIDADPGGLVEIARQSLAKADELLTSLPALLARDDDARLAALALDEVVAQVRDDVAFELRLAGATFEVRGRLPSVLGDRDRLRIALRNLVRNAIQHRRPEQPLRVTLRAWRRGDTWTLTLSDNGTGIPRRERARIFAPLQRGSGATRGGSGLGLAIARQAIEACGGSIAVSTRAGAGASFAITLRAAGAGAPAQ